MIVVTTPTGSIGRQLLQILIDAARPCVWSHAPPRLSSQARPHVEAVEGSHGDFEIVNRGFEGASSVLWIAPS